MVLWMVVNWYMDIDLFKSLIRMLIKDSIINVSVVSLSFKKMLFFGMVEMFVLENEF